MKNNLLKKTAASAMMVALSTVLSLIPLGIKLPLGGSLTPLSMLPVAIVAIAFGTGWGLTSAFVYALGQLFIGVGEALSWGLTAKALIGTIALDYLLAFTVLGLAGVFRKWGKAGAVAGIALALFLRFICHFASGIIIFDIWCEWDNVWIYSLCYNGAYMLPELVLTGIAAYFIAGRPLEQIKKQIG